MKNKYLLLSLIGLLSLSGCQFSKDSSSTSSSSISLTPFAKMLNTYKKGVQLKGEVNQKVYFIDGLTGEKTGGETSNTYNVSFTYQSGEENGYAGYIAQKLPNNEEVIYTNNKAFEGKDGFAYYYDINYDNTLRAVPHYDTTGQEQLNFAHYYINPFHYLFEEDFVKVNDNTYSLVREKANYFAASVLSDVDVAFQDINKVCNFIIENNEIKSINIVPADVYDSTTDYETWETVYYLLEQNATLNIEKVGSDVKIEKPKPNVVPSENKEPIAKLQEAFNKFKSNNYTMKVDAEFMDQQGNKKNEISTYYFTGDQVYLTYNTDSTTPDAEKDVFFYNNGTELIPLGYSKEDNENNKYAFSNGIKPKFLQLKDSYKYNEIAPVISEVNADIFNYNSRYKYYSLNEEMVSYISTLAFIPKVNTYSSMSRNTGTKLNVRINSENNIDYIDFNYNYDDGMFFYQDGKIRITFENVGTTTLPFDVMVID